MKRIVSILLIFLLLPKPAAGAISTGASSAVLMDADSGRVLYAHNPHDKRLIASITKLMTALVVLESGADLRELVKIDGEAVRAEGSSIYLRPGEEITVEGLLYGLLLHSGNDAALALALHCGGTVEDFVAQMNQKAQELGMRDSCFANPNGLNAENHYSTAYDMALLARACLENPTLEEIASTKSISTAGRVFTNHNKLLWRYEGCIGLKTGYTEKAGRTLVSAARRDGTTLIAVTLNDPDDWKDHAALLDYGFETYTRQELVRAGEEITCVPVSGSLAPQVKIAAGEGACYPVRAGENLQREVVLLSAAPQAPVRRGEAAGELVWRLNGEVAARVPLVYAGDAADCRAQGRGFSWKNVFKN